MPAFLIATVSIHDPETYKRYTALTPKTSADHGGKFVVRGGTIDTLEGEPLQDRLVILEFPSRQAVHDWYNSPEYQAAARIRQAASESRFIVVDRLEDGMVPKG
jgi:uncharacterized protein (DUF1330 family)